MAAADVVNFVDFSTHGAQEDAKEDALDIEQGTHEEEDKDTPTTTGSTAAGKKKKKKKKASGSAVVPQPGTAGELHCDLKASSVAC